MTGRARRAVTTVLAILGLSVWACASGSGGGAADRVTVGVTNQAGEPVQIRYVYGTAVPATLGTVRADAEASFSFMFSRAGDLRLIGEFVERRTGTSNPIMDLRPGDRLELTINQRKELRLARAPTR